jgi:starch phosphorylase
VFNMAVMGMRLAQRVNGVSRLHGEVSRQMFAGLWPGFDAGEVPIGYVTNGVHAPTWMSGEIAALGEAGKVSLERIWQTRGELRARLVAEARQRLRASWRQRGSAEAELTWIDDALDENVLTIGFARRVPSYKRLTLMLRDAERLKALLLDSGRPVQIIIAGKAHPADDGGKRLIQQMVAFTGDPAIRHRIVFLPDYDMALARALVRGCDVWLNNPLRPLEACGTSGMKSALNGGLNLSVRDGWWDECSDGTDGWDIPSADGLTDEERRDDLEAAALYELLTKTVAPMFYDRDASGLPRRWLEMVRHTLDQLSPRLQASRMVAEYVTEMYAPAARASREMAAPVTGSGPSFAAAKDLAAWRRRVLKGWPGVRIEHVEADVTEPRLGSRLAVRATVALGELTPGDVAVELVCGRAGDDDEIIDPWTATLAPDPADGARGGAVRYAGEAELGRAGPFGYTVRVLPSHRLLSSRAELGLVTLPDAPAGMTNGDLR